MPRAERERRRRKRNSRRRRMRSGSRSKLPDCRAAGLRGPSPRHSRSVATIAALLLLLVSLPVAHSQTQRYADLDRVRSEIVKLKNRLESLRTQARSAERDLEESDVELGIRTRELDLATDMQAQLEAQQQAL